MLFGRFRMPPRSDELPDCWNQRDADDRKDDDLEVVLDELALAEPISHERERYDPEQRSEHAESQELEVLHPADARDEWRERAHDRNEPGQDDRLAAVFLKELVRALQMLLLQPAAVIALKDFGTHFAADPIVDVVAAKRRRDERRHHQPQVRQPAAAKGAPSQRAGGK